MTQPTALKEGIYSSDPDRPLSHQAHLTVLHTIIQHTFTNNTQKFNNT